MPMHAPRYPGRMRTRNLTLIGRDQRGFALVEVLVSAVLLLMVSAGVYTAFAAGTRATAQERHRARANDLAEQELERVRSLRIADLTTLNRTSYMLEDGSSASSCPATSTQTCYTISSPSQFLTETATTSTCASGTGSRDYLRADRQRLLDRHGPTPPGYRDDACLAAERVVGAEQRVATGRGRRLEQQRNPRRDADRKRRGVLHRDDRIDGLRPLAESAGGHLHDDRLRGRQRDGRP